MKTKAKPKYVMMIWNGKRNTEMRLLKNGRYYRDAGNWDILAEWVDGVLTASPDNKHLEHLAGATFEAITENEWRIGQGQWAPTRKEMQE